MRHRIRETKAAAPRYATGAAWFFIVVSLLHLAWVVGVKAGDPSGAFKLYHTVVGERTYDGIGLTYTGVFGIVQALTQAALVVFAAAATIKPLNRLDRLRRLGHGLLIGWAALWAANLAWLASVDGAGDSFVQAAILSVLLACTVFRAMSSRVPPRRTLAPVDSAPPIDDEQLDARDVTASSKAREITPPKPPAASKLARTSGAMRRLFGGAAELGRQGVSRLRQAGLAAKARRMLNSARDLAAGAGRKLVAMKSGAGGFLRRHGLIPTAD